MIGFFEKAGDTDVAAAFGPYSLAFSRILKERIPIPIAGTKLALILIEYHLEGKHLQLPSPDFRVLPYRKSERSIAVVVAVPRTFSQMQELDKRRYIVTTTLEAVRRCNEAMHRRGHPDVDLSELRRLVEEAAVEYESLPSVLEGSRPSD